MVFRPWNPKRHFAAYGDDNRTFMRLRCPASGFFCCHLIEKCLKREYKGRIDFIDYGFYDSEEVLDKISNKGSKYFSRISILAFVVIFSGYLLIFTPSMHVIKELPLVYFL
jgi:hypothetical protein